VLGQLVFGALADKLGRRVMFISTISCVIVGALGSASPVASSSVPIYTQLCIWLFILGFGVGGEYPLSATVSSENNTVAGRGAAVSSVFSMQGIGNVLASFVMYVCLVACARSPGSMPLDWVWRTALLVGAVPGLATVYWRYKMEESKHFVRHKSTKAMVATGSLNTSSTTGSENEESLLGGYADVGKDARGGALKKACATFDLHNTWKTLYDFRWTLLGTAGNWFLFDISYYSNSLFSGSVLSEIGFSGNSSTASGLEKVALGNLYLALIGLPGYFVAIWAIDRMGRRNMQWFGFLMMAILFGILAIALEPIKANATGAFVFLYGE
jgi:PHS family inorganic phosphate transporter-like MFS transporter